MQYLTLVLSSDAPTVYDYVEGSVLPLEYLTSSCKSTQSTSHVVLDVRTMHRSRLSPLYEKPDNAHGDALPPSTRNRAPR
jgi:hypothetical protein